MGWFDRGSRSGDGRGGPGLARGLGSDDPPAFPPGIVERVRLLEVRARHLVDSLFCGEYRSIFKGRGIEFSEVREYQVGDDVRTIDWNVTARRGHPYVKRFVEEREMNLILLVDMSASLAFGTGPNSNSQVAAEIAALLALSAIRNNDRVGLLLVTDRAELFVPPRSGRRHVLRLLLELVAFRPTGRKTDLTVGMDYVARAFPHRCIVFLISDFILPGGVSQRFRDSILRVARRHDLVPVHLHDPGADSLPDLGWMRVVDPETGEDSVLNTGSRECRESFRAAIRTQRAEFSEFFKQVGVDRVEVDTREDCVAPFVSFFRRRERAHA